MAYMGHSPKEWGGEGGINWTKLPKSGAKLQVSNTAIYLILVPP